ncbi:MAG: YlbF family regulator [Clostridia bacterium]|nr:YlbF family regulator [Clostridia bacterium]
MDYVEAASQLGAAIAESGEFQAWKEAETALILDEKAPVLMQEYKDLQVKLVQGSRDDLAKEELEKIRDTLMAKQQELNEYPVTKAYFEGKKGFENMMRTVNDVIQHYVAGGGEGGCSGSCSSCSGCH